MPRVGQPHVLITKHLTVSYGRSPALIDVDLRVDSSHGVVGLFGANGAGKTTLLKTVYGDIQRYSGEVLGPPRADIAYLPDSPYLYRWLTVRECLELFSSRHPDFRTEAAEDFLAGSALGASRRVAEFSKGMSERLHLALTLARQPKLYILDEPLAGVDPLTRDHLLEMIRKYRVPDAPLLISTHLINGVDSIFDSVIMISDGRVLLHDDADRVRSRGNGNLEQAFKEVMAGND